MNKNRKKIFYSNFLWGDKFLINEGYMFLKEIVMIVSLTYRNYLMIRQHSSFLTVILF